MSADIESVLAEIRGASDAISEFVPGGTVSTADFITETERIVEGMGLDVLRRAELRAFAGSRASGSGPRTRSRIDDHVVPKPLRVIPLLRDFGPVLFGDTLVALLVEVWTVEWTVRLVRFRNHPPRAGEDCQWMVSDDGRISYELVSSSWRAHDPQFGWYDLTFSPSLPDTVRAITISAKNEDQFLFEVGLDLGGE